MSGKWHVILPVCSVHYSGEDPVTQVIRCRKILPVPLQYYKAWWANAVGRQGQMKCNRDSSLPRRVRPSLISSAKLEWIIVSSSLPVQITGDGRIPGSPGDLCCDELALVHESKHWFKILIRWSENKRLLGVHLHTLKLMFLIFLLYSPWGGFNPF